MASDQSIEHRSPEELYIHCLFPRQYLSRPHYFQAVENLIQKGHQPAALFVAPFEEEENQAPYIEAGPDDLEGEEGRQEILKEINPNHHQSAIFHFQSQFSDTPGRLTLEWMVDIDTLVVYMKEKIFWGNTERAQNCSLERWKPWWQACETVEEALNEGPAFMGLETEFWYYDYTYAQIQDDPDKEEEALAGSFSDPENMEVAFEQYTTPW